ncbi:MAG: hypothetical protein M3Z17_07930 [Gemmatimonadota bacterium]|nr:hypothetical protein [Gemmatimonadota bacterium]
MAENISASERGGSILGGLGTGALFLTALTPMLVLGGIFFPFVVTRNIFFRLCVEIALATILLGGVARLREIRGGADPILKWFSLFVVALAFAAVFGLSPWHSVFGDFERMGGVWAWLHLLLFYLALRILLSHTGWLRFLRLNLAVGVFIVIWGGAEFLPEGMRNPLFHTTLSFGSTTGNPGLLGPYLLLSLALSCWLLLNETRWWWKVFEVVCALILLFGIGGSRNRSSELGLLVGLFVAAAVFFLLHANRRSVIRKYGPAFAGVAVLLLGGGYLLSARAPVVADRLGGRWRGFLSSPVDHLRTIEWSIALKGFADRPLFGYGPENHQIVASHHFDPRIYAIEGAGIFDRAHNAWLELLATTGLAGTIAMLALWVATIHTLRDGIRRKVISPAEAALFSGALAGYAVYLTFWFFDINSVFVWVALLALLTFRVRGPLKVFAPASAVGSERRIRLPAIATVILIAFAAYLHGIVPFVAARDLSAATAAGPFEIRLAAFTRVMNSAAPQTLHTFPLYYRFLRASGSSMSAEASPILRKEFDLAVQRGLVEADRSIARNPQDDRSYVEAARFSLLAGLFYRDPRYFQYARDQLLKGVKISPNRPDGRILLSGILLSLGDTAKAAAQVDSAVMLAPDFGPAYFYSGKTLLLRGKVDSAALMLTAGLRRKHLGTEEIYESVVAALGKKGEALRAAELDQLFLESAYMPLRFWGKGNPPNYVSLTPVAERLADRLPLLYNEGGNRDSAIAAAMAFAAVHSAALPAATAFKSDLQSGSGTKWKGKSYIFPLGDSGSTQEHNAVRR